MTGMIIGAVVIYILFFIMCYFGTGTDSKNMGSYYSYPDAVQEKIKQDEKLKTMIPKKSSLTNVWNVLLFSFVFIVLGFILHLKEFGISFCYFLILGEGLNLFDLLVIDMCWWRHTNRTKFSTIPEKTLYKDMKKHLESFCRGIPVFALSAIVAAILLSLIG